MFTVIHSSYLSQECVENASLVREDEWGVSFVCSDKNKFEEMTVVRDVSLTQ